MPNYSTFQSAQKAFAEGHFATTIELLSEKPNLRPNEQALLGAAYFQLNTNAPALEHLKAAYLEGYNDNYSFALLIKSLKRLELFEDLIDCLNAWIKSEWRDLDQDRHWIEIAEHYQQFIHNETILQALISLDINRLKADSDKLQALRLKSRVYSDLAVQINLEHQDDLIHLRQNGTRIRETDLTEAKLKKTAKPDSRWPLEFKQMDNRESVFKQHLLPFIDTPKSKLPLDARVLTLGSCFAENVARALAERGIIAHSSLVREEVNSPLMNLKLVQALTGISEPNDEIANCLKRDSEQLNVKFVTTKPGTSFNELVLDTQLLIFTLGASSVLKWQDDESLAYKSGRKITGLNPGRPVSLLESSKTSVEENVNAVSQIIAILRSINPNLQVVISVSPVPLKGTTRGKSAVMEDCISKSTLRVAVETLIERDPSVSYWPSFEFMKWIGAHTHRPSFSGKDTRHLDSNLIRLMTEHFITTYFDENPT